MASRIVHKKRQYLVRYKGFSEAYDEWKGAKDVSVALVREYLDLLKRAEPPPGPA